MTAIDWLASREVVIGLAIAGALPSVLAGVLTRRGSIGASRARQLDLAGYGLMGLSMVLFIVAGFRSH